MSFSSLFPKFGIPTVCENRTCHMMEVPFVFHNSANYTFAPDEMTLSEQMLAYWTSFAKSSDPNNAGASSVAWPAYNGTAKMNLKLSNPITVESVSTRP